MEILNLFPTELFVFQNDTIDNESLVKRTQQLDEIEIKKSTTLSMLYDLRHVQEFDPLFAWFKQCLEEVRVKMEYDCEGFEITNSWFNVALGGYEMFQNYHRHSMSFYSAVYYLTEGSATVFEDPVLHRTQAQIEVLRHNYKPFYESAAIPGKLVIFPSWMYHRSLPHIGANDRYIISFNTMPVGKINHNLATDSKANLKVING
jgi:uncharacterized protein (TIGR02466 family)